MLDQVKLGFPVACSWKDWYSCSFLWVLIVSTGWGSPTVILFYRVGNWGWEVISLSTPQGAQSCDYLRPLGSIAAGMVLCRIWQPQGEMRLFKSGSLLWLTSLPRLSCHPLPGVRSCLEREICLLAVVRWGLLMRAGKGEDPTGQGPCNHHDSVPTLLFSTQSVWGMIRDGRRSLVHPSACWQGVP